MNVTVENGAVTAVLQTSTDSARHILQSDLGVLKQSLVEAGVHVDSINVTVGGSLDHGLQSHSGSHDWSTEHQVNRGPWQVDEPLGPELNPELVGSTGPSLVGSFNYLA
jgi:flagellar hook-length control protein FliK